MTGDEALHAFMAEDRRSHPPRLPWRLLSAEAAIGTMCIVSGDHEFSAAATAQLHEKFRQRVFFVAVCSDGWVMAGTAKEVQEHVAKVGYWVTPPNLN